MHNLESVSGMKDGEETLHDGQRVAEHGLLDRLNDTAPRCCKTRSCCISLAVKRGTVGLMAQSRTLPTDGKPMAIIRGVMYVRSRSMSWSRLTKRFFFLDTNPRATACIVAFTTLKWIWRSRHEACRRFRHDSFREKVVHSQGESRGNADGMKCSITNGG